MADTFFAAGTVVASTWLNDVNAATYRANSGISGATPIRSAVSKFSDFVSVKDFGATGDGVTNDTAAVQLAVNSAYNIIFPAGAYLLDTITVRDKTQWFGMGDASELRQNTVSGASFGLFHADSLSSSTFLDGLRISNLKIVGKVATLGFEQHTYLVSLNGVSDVLIDNCTLEGFRGDAIYLGSSPTDGPERHNKNVIIQGNHFDGVNNDNRNAISIIDGTNIKILNNSFINCTRSNMPGAIDLEPNAHAFHVIKDVLIQGNTFDNIGGNVGVISMEINAVVPLPTNIKILNNIFRGAVTSTGHAEIDINVFRIVTAADVDQAIEIAGNYFLNGSITHRFFSGKGLSVHDNVWEGTQNGGILAASGGTNYWRDVNFTKNKFIRCATTTSNDCLTVFSVDYLTLSQNLFSDCGDGNANACAIDFNAGTSSYIKLLNNEILAVTGKTTVGIQKEAAHTFTPSTNVFRGNALHGLSNFFQGKFGIASYDPPSLADGAGTTTTVTCNGAVLGDYVNVSFSLNLQGITVTGYVSAADTVSVRFQNETGGVIDLGSGTLSVLTETLA